MTSKDEFKKVLCEAVDKMSDTWYYEKQNFIGTYGISFGGGIGREYITFYLVAQSKDKEKKLEDMKQ